MTNPFSDMLETHDVILADGATGTNLFNAGLMAGDAPELWNVEQPRKIRDLYQSAVSAGSDLFLTNTFGGNASRMKLHSAQRRVRELNRVGAEIGRDVADRAGRKVIVAGSVGPTGEIMIPVGTLSHELAVEMFHEQADGLKEGGADIAWLETISAPEEFRAAAEAFGLAGLAWCGTMSFDTAGRTMMGLTSADMVKMVDELDNPPLAFGANCGTGASDILRTVLGFTAQGTKQDAEQGTKQSTEQYTGRPLISKGNAGIPKYVDGHIHYDGTPALMADYAVMARDSGARIIGGCCGTMPEHLERMREALDSRPRGDRPTLDQITGALGGFSSVSDGTGENTGPQRRNRSKRRRA